MWVRELSDGIIMLVHYSFWNALAQVLLPQGVEWVSFAWESQAKGSSEHPEYVQREPEPPFYF